MNGDQNCSNCRFSVLVLDGPTLFCHRYPPQLIATDDRPFDSPAEEPAIAALWPMVGPDDVCGEHLAQGDGE